MENNLPTEWTWVKLGEACSFIGGGTPSKKEDGYWNGNIFWASVKDVKGDYLNSTEDTITETGLKNSAASIAEPNDVILITRISPGKTIITNVRTAINQDLKIVKPKFETTSKFLSYYFKSIERKLISKSSGTTVLGITLNILNEITIPLLSIETQNTIVSKIEELYSELDKGIEYLRMAQQQLKTYRQSLLKCAFAGKLTNDNVKEGVLPEGWRWVKFGDIHEIKSNLVNALEHLDSPHIAPDNISKGTAQLLSYNTIEEDKVFSPKHKFYKGQIVYSKIRPNLSKVIIAPIDGLCSADMYPIDSALDNRFTLYYMLTNVFVSKASNTESRTILPKINQKGLNEIPFPLCTLDEQRIIVREIESRLTVADKMEESITQSLQQAEALRQSILKKAFEGKLIK